MKILTPIVKLDRKSFNYLVTGQLIALLLIWWFSPFIFLPTPIQSWHALGVLWQGGIVNDLIESLYLNIQSVGISILVSLGCAYLYTIPFFSPIIQSISKLRFLSLVGLTFFFTLAASNQHSLKVALLVFSITVFFVTSLLDVVINIPKEQYDLGRTLRMSNWELLKEIVIYGQADKAFDCLRQNAAIGWMMTTMVEGLARSDGGIGVVLINHSKYSHLPEVLVIQLIILALGLCQDYLLGYIKTVVCPYSNLTLEHK